MCLFLYPKTKKVHNQNGVLTDITLTGFDGAEVDELLDTFYSHEAVQDDFNEQEAKEEIKAKGTKTKAGDIWKLGNHRLLCGDPKKAEDFAKLMNGTKAQMAMTNPPFALGNDYEKQGIAPWLEEMDKALSNIIRHSSLVCWNLGDMYATGSQFIEPTSVYSVNLFKNLGFRPIWIRIWKKQGKAFGGGNYHLTTNKPTSQYEYISAFARENQPEYNDQEYVWVSAFANHSCEGIYKKSKRKSQFPKSAYFSAKFLIILPV